ncbi:MAG: DUF115 domain-containing protein [Planctomycetes bacterium]|nr:DUF115 domain-containing protein [Planctomycetota bacterium]
MPPDPSILRANLAALAKVNAALAQRLAETTPAELEWSDSKAGPLTATRRHEGKTLGLASRFDPLTEAKAITNSVDFTKHGGVVVLGLALGYHVTHLAAQVPNDGLLIVYEPDATLIRAVLERIDHRRWLGRSNIHMVDSTIERGDLVRRVEKFGAIMLQGTAMVTHPCTRQTHGAALQAFTAMFGEVMAYYRTNVATTLVNSSRTIANLTANLAYYAAGANTNELHNAARGFPAVCVGAGPSLARNVDLLRDPAVRGNVIVITAQTTLKPLLDRGIRPDFVTALDYHEISKRFYEGLPRLDDVTLVAEPKANPSILDSFPGPIRVTASSLLDRLLGEHAAPMISIPSGATVAHLSFYLAQHLGCDPIILIGQDLGFSDGLYYCPGTAIHDVWAPELGAFNTLEMLEWQRIVRHRNHLKKLDDIHGQPIYTDEQMLTYLKQFERDFSHATQTIIDATEGGLPKQHTTRVPLAEAVARHATRPVPTLPRAGRGFDAGRVDDVLDVIRQRIRESEEIRSLARKTIPILRQMREHQRDRERMDKLFHQVERNKRRVDELNTTFTLLNEINAIGCFKRARTDRAILNDNDADPVQRQQRQLDRDIENLEWLIQSCDEGLRIFTAAIERVQRAQNGVKPGATERETVKV